MTHAALSSHHHLCLKKSVEEIIIPSSNSATSKLELLLPATVTLRQGHVQINCSGGSASEGAAMGFFAADNVPDLSVSCTGPFQIARMFEHYRNPTLPTDFD